MCGRVLPGFALSSVASGMFHAVKTKCGEKDILYYSVSVT